VANACEPTVSTTKAAAAIRTLLFIVAPINPLRQRPKTNYFGAPEKDH
jgi:hypothetical protein